MSGWITSYSTVEYSRPASTMQQTSYCLPPTIVLIGFVKRLYGLNEINFVTFYLRVTLILYHLFSFYRGHTDHDGIATNKHETKTAGDTEIEKTTSTGSSTTDVGSSNASIVWIFCTAAFQNTRRSRSTSAGFAVPV